ncbi:hypothetical protein IGI47_002452 [Enterococcus sp. AZ191]|uniref:GTP pyrophosphokinase n=1 Tax=Enterococcus sp. AZ191 TaxID=2774639 RepID=UPI003F1F3B3F
MSEIPIEELMNILNKESNATSPSRALGIEAIELYQELEVYYHSALDEVETKLFIIDRELSSNSHRGRKNSIHQIQKRIKRFKSVVNKLNRKQLDYSEQAILANVRDFAGLRVICSYSDDIYTLINSLSHHPDITILTIKDYLKHPKPSGYRSVHVVLEVPVYFLEETKKSKLKFNFGRLPWIFGLV